MTSTPSPEMRAALAALEAAQHRLKSEREKPGEATPDDILRVIADALKPWAPAPPRGLEFKRDPHGLVFTLTFHDGNGRAVEASWRGPDATVVMKAVGCEPNKEDRGCSSAAIKAAYHASDNARQVTELRLALEQHYNKVKQQEQTITELRLRLSRLRRVARNVLDDMPYVPLDGAEALLKLELELEASSEATGDERAGSA